MSTKAFCVSRKIIVSALAVLVVSLASLEAAAQSTTTYGYKANGSSAGRSVQRGNTTYYYNANGSSAGRSEHRGNTTYYYNANGYDSPEQIAPVVDCCVNELLKLDCRIVWNPSEADVAIAPLLQTKLKDEELLRPKHGTLIFHPSLLPRHRGRDAIRWAYHLEEKYTGATWFWADSGLDTGDICEQEVVAIDGKRPRDFYEQDVIPVCVRLLRYVILDLKAGIVRRRPQNESAATCEPPFPRTPRPE